MLLHAAILKLLEYINLQNHMQTNFKMLINTSYLPWNAQHKTYLTIRYVDKTVNEVKSYMQKCHLGQSKHISY